MFNRPIKPSQRGSTSASSLLAMFVFSAVVGFLSHRRRLRSLPQRSSHDYSNLRILNRTCHFHCFPCELLLIQCDETLMSLT